MSKRSILLVLFAIGLLAVAGCGGGAKEPVTDPADTSAAWPKWFTNTPTDENFHLAAATATSQDVQMAINKAELDAQAKLATQVSAQYQSMMTRFLEEVGAGADAQLLDKATQATKRTTDEVLVGVRTREQQTLREGDIWRAFVLSEMPVATAEKALLGGITQDEELYTRFRESQAFQALEKAVGE